MGDDAQVRALSPARSGALILVAIFLVGANLRASITGVGPLLEQIERDLDLAPALLGALGSIPVATWAVVSPLAHTLSQRWGASRVVSVALIMLGIGTAVRSLPGPMASLWIGTVCIGAALAIMNVLLPAVIKACFPRRVPTLTALLASTLSAFGALGSGLVVPLSISAAGGDPRGDWRIALLATGALIPIALVVWWLTTRHRLGTDAAAREAGRSGIWRDGLAWRVALYMGVQSASFYMLVTWLAPYAVAQGRTQVAAGIDVMAFQLIGIGGSFLAPLLLHSRLRRWAPAVSPWIGIVGVLGLLLAPGVLLLWALVAGVSAGSSLSMSLTLMSERAADSRAASALSGMSQSVGYAIAALGPIAFGALLGATGGWTAPLLLVLAALLAQSATGLGVGREQQVLMPR